MIINYKTTNAAAYWKAERLIMTATGVSAAVHMWTSTDGSFDNPIATYLADAAGVVKIDVTDYIRTYGNKQLRFAETSGNVYLVQVSVRGLINPDSVIIPPSGWLYGKIMPPYKMYRATTAAGLIARFYPSGYTWDAAYTLADGTISRETDVNQELEIPQTAVKISVASADPEPADDIERNLSPLLCDHRYAAVRWEDFMGDTRLHTWEVVKQKTDATDTYSLMNLNNEWEEIKGRTDGFTLRMDGLCLYDMWYYSDLITSSKVEVSLDGEFYRVQVTSKSFTMPDGENNNGKIEINVNYRRYDAVTM